MASTPSDAPTRLTVEPPENSDAVYRVLLSLAWLTTRPFRLKAVGVENVPREGGVVLASIHRSNWDTFAIGAPLPFRQLRPMAKVELYKNPVLGWIIQNGGGFPVDRGKADATAVATAVALLEAGELLCMYPEGTRNRTGKARVHTGAARLALETDAAFVPVAHSGTDQVRAWPPRFPQFRVAYGKPIPLDDLREWDDMRRASFEATERWKRAVAELQQLV
jgi:1-acyl-sn-glycerol-3-phosphate acyltransferase